MAFLFSSVVRKVGVACQNLKHGIGFDCWCMVMKQHLVVAEITYALMVGVDLGRLRGRCVIFILVVWL